MEGLFPGESKEATSEEGGQGRLDKMVGLGVEIVGFLRPIGDIKPEVTGSIILSAKGYKGTPEDLDVNVTTSGTPDERKEQWEAIAAYMNQFDGVSVHLPAGGKVRVFPLTPGRW